MTQRTRVVVVGGGHNGLAAAAYLAQAGIDVVVLEALGEVGGAAVSAQVFPGVNARLSRYSYLVSLLPRQIISELGLSLDLRSRSVASYTPVVRGGTDTGLLVERTPGGVTEESFRAVTGGPRDYSSWQDFYDRMERAAGVIAPTMLSPLLTSQDMAERVIAAAGAQTWAEIAQVPMGETLMSAFGDDDVRGVIATDGLIGTYASVFDQSLLANRCLLYHLIGDGTGEWKVPVGGMGAVSTALRLAAESAGARIVTNAQALKVETDGAQALVTYRDDHDSEQCIAAEWVLSNAAPDTLERLLGREPSTSPQGSQVKVNMVLTRLPRLRSGIDPRIAFAGTFHISESLAEVEDAFAATVRGEFPEPLPAEIYCHTLTDPSILSGDLIDAGWHTMTLFGLHTPAHLFDSESSQRQRQQVLDSYLDGLDRFLAEPIRDCLAIDANGEMCAEARTPLDIEASVGLPGGHIFHRDLRWPWSPSGNADPDSVPGAWGVETQDPNVLVCGAGARRGGGVSAVPGRAAAMKVISTQG